MQTQFCRQDFQMTGRCLMVMLCCFSAAIATAAEPLVQWNFAGEDSAKESSMVSWLKLIGQAFTGFGSTICNDESDDPRQ